MTQKLSVAEYKASWLVSYVMVLYIDTSSFSTLIDARILVAKLSQKGSHD